MARVSTFLCFNRKTEQAFLFYQQIFGGEFSDPFYRFGDMPFVPGQKPMAEQDKNLVTHVALPILGGHVIMGADHLDSEPELQFGNTIFLTLEPETMEESQRLFSALSAEGKVEIDFQKMYWGAYYAKWVDKFGVGWMLNFQLKE